MSVSDIKYNVKLVPDSEPNAEGEWVTIAVHRHVSLTYEDRIRPGWHIVAIEYWREDAIRN